MQGTTNPDGRPWTRYLQRNAASAEPSPSQTMTVTRMLYTISTIDYKDAWTLKFIELAYPMLYNLLTLKTLKRVNVSNISCSFYNASPIQWMIQVFLLVLSTTNIQQASETIIFSLRKRRTANHSRTNLECNTPGQRIRHMVVLLGS